MSPLLGAVIGICHDCDDRIIIVDTLTQAPTWSFTARCQCRSLFMQAQNERPPCEHRDPSYSHAQAMAYKRHARIQGDPNGLVTPVLETCIDCGGLDGLHARTCAQYEDVTEKKPTTGREEGGSDGSVSGTEDP